MDTQKDLCAKYKNLNVFDNRHALSHSNLVTSPHPVFYDYTAINKTFVLALPTDPYGMLNYTICLHKIDIKTGKNRKKKIERPGYDELLRFSGHSTHKVMRLLNGARELHLC